MPGPGLQRCRERLAFGQMVLATGSSGSSCWGSFVDRTGGRRLVVRGSLSLVDLAFRPWPLLASTFCRRGLCSGGSDAW